jgi:hypothetical protein
MKGLLPLAALSLAMFSSQSYALTGQEFHDKCQGLYTSPGKETPQEAVSRALNAGSCSGFVGGMIEGVSLIGRMLEHKGAVKKNFICLPPGKKSQQLLEEVLTYVENNPKVAGEPVQVSIYNTFAESYPCIDNSAAPAQ